MITLTWLEFAITQFSLVEIDQIIEFRKNVLLEKSLIEKLETY